MQFYPLQPAYTHRMRVTTGTAKGRKLASVPGSTTRPITDRVKQALFNIIADDVKNCTMLDLFGGTGAVGIEALSRGAQRVTFIDSAMTAVKTMQGNLKALGLDARASVVKQDAFAYLGAQPNQRYDFIYIAPPQYEALWLKALMLVDANPHWLADMGCVICQIDPREYAQVVLQNLEPGDERKYGNTMLLFFERKPGWRAS